MSYQVVMLLTTVVLASPIALGDLPGEAYIAGQSADEGCLAVALPCSLTLWFEASSDRSWCDAKGCALALMVTATGTSPSPLLFISSRLGIGGQSFPLCESSRLGAADSELACAGGLAADVAVASGECILAAPEARFGSLGPSPALAYAVAGTLAEASFIFCRSTSGVPTLSYHAPR